MTLATTFVEPADEFRQKLWPDEWTLERAFRIKFGSVRGDFMNWHPDTIRVQG